MLDPPPCTSTIRVKIKLPKEWFTYKGHCWLTWWCHFVRREGRDGGATLRDRGVGDGGAGPRDLRSVAPPALRKAARGRALGPAPRRDEAAVEPDAGLRARRLAQYGDERVFAALGRGIPRWEGRVRHVCRGLIA